MAWHTVAHPPAGTPWKLLREVDGTTRAFRARMLASARLPFPALLLLAGAIGCSSAPIGSSGRDTEAGVQASGDAAPGAQAAAEGGASGKPSGPGAGDGSPPSVSDAGGAQTAADPDGDDSSAPEDDSGDDGGPSFPDGCVGDAAGACCSTLANTASTQVYAAAVPYLACSSDSDCTRIAFSGAGACALLCGEMLTNEAGATALPGVAATACQGFTAQGCQTAWLGCPLTGGGSGDTPYPYDICASGTCANWTTRLTSSDAPITHGVCAELAIQYIVAYSQTAVAPRDIDFAMTADNGTMYSDTACTTPLADATVTLPAGTSSVAFGFEPLAAGQAGLSGTASASGATIGLAFDVQ